MRWYAELLVCIRGDAHETLGVASLGTVSRSLGNVCTELRKAEAVRESTSR